MKFKRYLVTEFLDIFIWVPDPELLALNPEEKFGASEALLHLEEWDRIKWGLPPLPGFNVIVLGGVTAK
ncbi:hypothetical protein B9479_007959, partial [Cryptococcus floricola]